MFMDKDVESQYPLGVGGGGEGVGKSLTAPSEVCKKSEIKIEANSIWYYGKIMITLLIYKTNSSLNNWYGAAKEPIYFESISSRLDHNQAGRNI